MKSNLSYTKIVLYVVLLLLPLGLQAQFFDDFSDGDLAHNPSWLGDTALFRVNNSRQLQLHDSQAGEAFLFSPFCISWDRADTMDCFVHLGFSPTANNAFSFGLYSANADHSPLLVVESTSSKSLSLWAHGASEGDTSVYRLAASSPSVRVRVTTSPLLGTAQLWLDTLCLATPQYSLAATVFHFVTPSVGDICFGIHCRYTASRSTSFFFDDIRVADGRENILPLAIAPGQVLVSEVLFNPHPGGADYVELFNATDSVLHLQSLCLAQVASDGAVGRLYALPSVPMRPRSWCVLTSQPDYVRQFFHVPHPDQLVLMGTMPSLPDAGGTVLLVRADSTVIDRLDYSAQMHSPLLRTTEGVSLERRSYEAPTQSPTNWFSAASTTRRSPDLGQGTPTAPNSQSQEFLFAQSDWELSSSVFSPDGDGYNDLLDIYYHLSLSNLSASITLFDAQGRPVRHLLRSGVLGPSGHLVWDGTDDNGRLCPRGAYVLFVQAFDSKGHRQTSKLSLSLVTN